jgi:hypothetical protein
MEENEKLSDQILSILKRFALNQLFVDERLHYDDDNERFVKTICVHRVADMKMVLRTKGIWFKDSDDNNTPLAFKRLKLNELDALQKDLIKRKLLK